MNRCHPYAQCIYVTSTADYECRCNPGYEGDGMECIKTGTFARIFPIHILIPNISNIVARTRGETRETFVDERIHNSLLSSTQRCPVWKWTFATRTRLASKRSLWPSACAIQDSRETEPRAALSVIYHIFRIFLLLFLLLLYSSLSLSLSLSFIDSSQRFPSPPRFFLLLAPEEAKA